jgi:hypothetical protein
MKHGKDDTRTLSLLPHVPVNKDAALSELEQIAAAIPVFRVLSTTD